MGVRLCHAGENVLIVLNCLFNKNIPLAALPRPPIPPDCPLCLPGSLCRPRGANDRQRCFLKTVQLSKWPWHFHNARPGSSALSSAPPPLWAPLTPPHPPAQQRPRGHGCCYVHVQATTQQTGYLWLSSNLFYSTSHLFILNNPVKTRSEYMKTLRNKKYPRVFGKVWWFFFTFLSLMSILATLYWPF